MAKGFPGNSRAVAWLAGFLLILTILPTLPAAPPNPCSKSECPDLLIDGHKLQKSLKIETTSWSAHSCTVKEGYATAGTHKILKLTMTTINNGTGDLTLGNPATNPAAFQYSACHQHYHLASFGAYRLWNESAYRTWNNLRRWHPDLTASEVLSHHPDLRKEFFAGQTMAWCVLDYVIPTGAKSVPPAKYTSCKSNQGIQKGWADEFDTTMLSQWIMIDGHYGGKYILEVEVNPERVLAESDYANNRFATEVWLDGPSRYPNACVTGKCVDLVVDQYTLDRDVIVETMDFTPFSCAVKEGLAPVGKHRMVRFTTTTLNVGSGELFFGDPAKNPQWFEWHECHQHYHFQGYADYRVWEEAAFNDWNNYRRWHPQLTAEELLDYHPELRSRFVASNKVGFCIRDDSGPKGELPPGLTPKYTECDKLQGLSPGFGDKYDKEVQGQWILADSLAPGKYVLEVELNPGRTIAEENVQNNRAWTSLTIK